MPPPTITKSADKRHALKIVLCLIGITVLGGLALGLGIPLARVFTAAIVFAKSPMVYGTPVNSLDALFWAYPEVCFVITICVLMATPAAFLAFVRMLRDQA